MSYHLTPHHRNKEWLLDHHFRYSSKLSSSDESVYTYVFPVWKAGEIIALEAKITVTLETGEAIVDVYDSSFHGRYAPWYLKQSYYEPLLGEIQKKIDSKLTWLHIKEDNESGE